MYDTIRKYIHTTNVQRGNQKYDKKQNEMHLFLFFLIDIFCIYC